MALFAVAVMREWPHLRPNLILRLNDFAMIWAMKSVAAGVQAAGLEIEFDQKCCRYFGKSYNPGNGEMLFYPLVPWEFALTFFSGLLKLHWWKVVEFSILRSSNDSYLSSFLFRFMVIRVITQKQIIASVFFALVRFGLVARESEDTMLFL